ncbi:hypothetical protein [Streptomyces peucetius]|uniref:Lipoprotein n=1 Tax=Streptomyces peucetius TaxID=1950 RepID=A0ABY6IH42_STRPE|nr:hypothetical protein [Streptomyces peucetius]UYQ66318.1 hypothetical protein OGH68_35980 [Streptomyces peucetius]
MLNIKGKSLPAERRAAVTFAVVTVVALGFTGCGGSGDSGGSGKKHEVASLEKGNKKPSAAASSADADGGRPRLRVDSTEDEVRALYNAYYSCLQQHGGKAEQVTGPKSGGEYVLGSPEDEQQPAEAVKACEKKNPLPPPETDPQQNPNYAENFRAWVACINDRGLRIKALPDGSGWNWDSSISEEEKGSARVEKIIRDCEIEAFK